MVEKNKEPKDLQTALDCAVRDSLKGKGGYKIKGDIYYNYMTNDEWEDFLREMEDCHQKQFYGGNGGETKGNKYPPKMASYGSSSRFIYELSHKIPGFSFEEKLDTKVGGIANLDGFIRSGTEYIYVEAKKREIYNKSEKKISEVYLPAYKYIQNCCKMFAFNQFCTEGARSIAFKIGEDDVKYFDMKQMICHFLGITYDLAKHSIKNAKVKFLYLLYNPCSIEKFLHEKYKEKVIKRFDEVKEFIECNQKVLESIFSSVLNYQIETNHFKEINIDFEIKMVDQNNYLDEFKDFL